MGGSIRIFCYLQMKTNTPQKSSSLSYEYCAALYDRMEIIKYLYVSLNGKINVLDLYIAAAKNGSLSVVKQLENLNIHLKKQDAQRLFKSAISSGSIPFVDWLLTKDNFEGALFSAIESNRIRVLEFLIKKGFSPNRKGKSGSTPVHYAAKRGTAEALYILLSNGGNPSAYDEKCHTPTYYAIRRDSVDCVSTLDRFCQTLDDETPDTTALAFAHRMGASAVIEYLESKGYVNDGSNKTYTTYTYEKEYPDMWYDYDHHYPIKKLSGKRCIEEEI